LASSIRTVAGAEILEAPSPGVGDLHETITIVKLNGPGTPAALVKAVEDAQTVHRAEILPGVRTMVTGVFTPQASPDAIVEALKDANLLEPE
jgi:hypothetical protein